MEFLEEVHVHSLKDILEIAEEGSKFNRTEELIKAFLFSESSTRKEYARDELSSIFGDQFYLGCKNERSTGLVRVYLAFRGTKLHFVGTYGPIFIETMPEGEQGAGLTIQTETYLKNIS